MQNNLAQNMPSQAAGSRPNCGKRETILNQLIPADGRGSRYAAWGVVLLVLAQLGWLQSRPGSELRRLCTATTKSPAGRAAVTEREQFDQLASQAGNGNVVLKLAGYAGTNPAVENSLGYFYFRTSYALYPRRLYAGPADQVINDGRDIMRIGFSPVPQWLQAHDVRSVLIFGNDKPGGKTPRLESLPSQDAPAGNSGGNR